MGIGLFNSMFYVGFAVHRKNAELGLMGASDVILEHFLKVLLFDDRENINHWYREILGQLRKILKIRLKPKDRVPSPKMVEGIFFGFMEKEGEVKREVRSLLKDYEDEEVYEDLYLENRGLDYSLILDKWVEFVGFINEKFAREEEETSVEELREVIGR